MAKTEAPEQTAPEQTETNVADLPMIAIRRDASGQIDRTIVGIPLPTDLAERVFRHFGSASAKKGQVNFAIAEAVAPYLATLVGVSLPEHSVSGKLQANTLRPAIDSMRKATVRAMLTLKQTPTRQTVEAKMIAKIAASTNQSIMRADQARIDATLKHVLDTYFAQVNPAPAK